MFFYSISKLIVLEQNTILSPLFQQKYAYNFNYCRNLLKLCRPKSNSICQAYFFLAFAEINELFDLVLKNEMVLRYEDVIFVKFELISRWLPTILTLGLYFIELSSIVSSTVKLKIGTFRETLKTKPPITNKKHHPFQENEKMK